MRTITLVSLVTVASVAACDTVDSGKEGILAFEWNAATQLVPSTFSTRLANGTRAGVNVYGSEKDKTAASVVNAESANPAVAEVVATAGNVITLEGRGAGTTEITVESVAGTDKFDVTVADIDLIDLDLPGAITADTPKSKGIQGGTARFLMRLKDADGNVLIGTGEAVEDGITVDPTSGAQLGDPQELGSLSLIFSAPGTLQITGKKDSMLEMEVIADADVTGLAWRGLSNSLVVGTTSVAILRGTTAVADETVVGVASLATVTTSTPTICTIEPNGKLGEGVYNISAKAKGDCQISATLGSRADTASFSIVAP